MVEEKKPTIKRTILGYKQESLKSGSCGEGKGRQKNNKTKNSKALKYVFKLCKQSKKDKKDTMGMPCILGKDGKLKVTLQEKIKVWKEYEEKLLNDENDWNKSLEITKVEGPCEVSTEDVMDALDLMNTGKAAGPSGVTVELLNVCKNESVRSLAKVANNMLEGNKMPEC